MAVRRRNPTSAGRRFQTVHDYNEITKDHPERSLIAKKSSTGGRNNEGRITARHRGGGNKTRYRSSTSSATRTVCRPRSRRSNTTPTAPSHRACCTISTARSATSLRPKGSVWATASSRGRVRRSVGQCVAAAVHPGRTVVPKSICALVAAQEGAFGGHRSAVDRQRNEYATLRLPRPRCAGCRIDCRARWARSAIQNTSSQSARRSQAWRACARNARRCHEPRDHPHGGWRGQDSGGPPPVSPRESRGRTASRRKHHRVDSSAGVVLAAARGSHAAEV